MKNPLFAYRNQVVAGAVTLLAIGATFAAPPLTPFFPNETLNPSCAPGSPNCYIQSIDNDQQTLSVSGSTLSILNGNSVSLPSGADNLGNHTATSNINLNGKYLSGDGTNK